MSTDLRRVLTERAERAERAEHIARPDHITAVLAEIGTTSRQRARRRRAVLASAGGSVAVLAVVAGSLVLARPTSHPGNAPAPAPAAAGRPHATAAAVRPHTAGDDVQLVPIAPTPAAAEISISTVPEGWTFEGYSDSTATYLAPGAESTGPDAFVGKITLMVSNRFDPASDYQLTIAGHQARVSHDDYSNLTAVDLLVPDQGTMPLEVSLYVPDSTQLDNAQIIQLAETIDIRSTEHYGVG